MKRPDVINQELMENIARAVKLKLLPVEISELEFTVDSRGHASSIEYWPSSSRMASQRVEITIPKEYVDQFIFPYTTTFYKNHLQ